MGRTTQRLAVGVATCALLVGAASSALAAGEQTSQTAGVDNTRTGAYRSLAQLSYEVFQKGDMPKAAELARILERTWDAAEEGGGPRSLGVTNKALFEELDHAMDLFIKPILHYTTKAPDPAAVEAAYKDFIEKLKKAD